MRFHKKRIAEIIDYLNGKLNTKPLGIDIDQAEVEDGVLYYKGKEVVPYEDRNEFIGKMYKDPGNPAVGIACSNIFMRSMLAYRVGMLLITWPIVKRTSCTNRYQNV